MTGFSKRMARICRRCALGAAIWIAGCAAQPPAPLQGSVDTTATPAAVSADWRSFEDRKVRWGGKIVKILVKEDATWVEIMGLPLDSKGKPMQVDASQGRFLVRIEGFLEPEIYAKGRLMSFLGRIAGVRKGKVGERPYTYPVLEAEGYHLWPRGKRRQRPPVIIIPAGYWDPFWPGYRVYPGRYYPVRPAHKGEQVPRNREIEH